MLQSVFLLLGSNRGDREQNLLQACAGIQKNIGAILKVSSVYETEPWGFSDSILFYNQAIEAGTRLTPAELLQEIHKIEKDLGRIREIVTCGPGCESSPGPYFPRTIDIDILFYGSKIIFTEDLMVPHPRLHERMFVLVPLDEIAPAFIHPVYRRSVTDLLKQCTDKSTVRRISL